MIERAAGVKVLLAEKAAREKAAKEKAEREKGGDS